MTPIILLSAELKPFKTFLSTNKSKSTTTLCNCIFLHFTKEWYSVMKFITWLTYDMTAFWDKFILSWNDIKMFLQEVQSGMYTSMWNSFLRMTSMQQICL